MTDARCERCTEKKVRLVEKTDQYQLERTACGKTWYASRDEASTLTIDAPSFSHTVGTAPWATAKFDDAEKRLISPLLHLPPLKSVHCHPIQKYAGVGHLAVSAATIVKHV